MKKFFSILMIAFAAISLVSCSCDRDDEVTSKFKSILTEDYNLVSSEHSDFVFYESQIVFDKKLEDVQKVSEMTIAEIENVFQAADTAYIIRHNLIDSTTEVCKYNDFWLGDMPLDTTQIVLNPEQALAKYEQSDITRTTGNKMTLRIPTHPMYIGSEPLYILGQMNSPLFVLIGATTGNVKPMDETNEYGFAAPTETVEK